MSQVKQSLTDLLKGKASGAGQYVELPVSLVRAALTSKPAGACERQPQLLAATVGLRDHEKVFQSADDWLVISGELEPVSA